MSIYDESLWDIMESEAMYRFFIQWENEEPAKHPAILVCNKYSVGAINNKWTVWFYLIAHWEFNNQKDALNKVKQIFQSTKEKRGVLRLNTPIGKIFCDN